MTSPHTERINYLQIKVQTEQQYIIDLEIDRQNKITEYMTAKFKEEPRIKSELTMINGKISKAKKDLATFKKELEYLQKSNG